MKLGIISDTHGYYEYTKKGLDILNDCDLIVHLGDILAPGPRNPIVDGYDPISLYEFLKEKSNIVYVKGNCDADVDEMVLNTKFLDNNHLVIDVDGIKILCMHGYKESDIDRLNLAKSLHCKYVINGHLHINKIYEMDGICYINIGSTSLPKDGIRSVAVFENDKLDFIDIETKKKF